LALFRVGSARFPEYEMSYRLFGAESSAYSTKLRSYLKYKAMPFEWVPRTAESEGELRTHARFPTLPILVTASGFAVHDTTPLVEALEADSPEPSATPADGATAFLSCVLEEYADVWLAKAVYHYRWGRKKDQRIAAARALDDYYGANVPEDRKTAEDQAIETMTSQMKTMGLEGELGGAVEKSFKKFIKLLDDHLRKHLCLFGERPSVADFAIAGQLIQALKDPTPAKIIEKDGEFVAKWCEFMADPKPNGPFAALDDLKETLAPLFAEDLAEFFLPWAAENLENSLAGNEAFAVTLGKEEFQLVPLRSAARSFRELRRKFVSGQTIEALKAFTDETASTVYLLRPARVDQRPERIPMPIPHQPEEGAEGDASEASDGAEAGEAQPQEGGEAREGGGRKRRRRRRGRGRGEGRGGEEGAPETSADVLGDEASGPSGEADMADTGYAPSGGDPDADGGETDSET
jgi:glutathione S-transferase